MPAIQPMLIERLEARTFFAAQPSATASMVGNVLEVKGRLVEPNTIVVRVQTSQVPAGNAFVVIADGNLIATEPTSSVALIQVFGGARPDNIQVDVTNATDSSGAPKSVPAYVVGGAGADTLTGSSGNDTIFGGPGNDVITDGDGNDLVKGGAGNDVINVGTGNDTVEGGAGNDVIIVQAQSASSTPVSSDLLDGGPGNDLIVAASGNDLLTGGPGNDTLSAGNGNDTMLGGAGRDRLVGSSGVDDMVGGPGIDEFFNVGPQDTVEDRAPGEPLVTLPSPASAAPSMIVAPAETPGSPAAAARSKTAAETIAIPLIRSSRTAVAAFKGSAHLARSAFLRAAIVASTIASAMGCSATPQSPQQLQDRLSAAKLISSDWSRDQALTSIAVDAARIKKVDICVEAADQIQGDSLRDLTVSTCIQSLKNYVPPSAAEYLTNRIGNDNLRDQVLAFLSKAQSIPPAPKSNGKG